jgi:SulP family sulfate permease
MMNEKRFPWFQKTKRKIRHYFRGKFRSDLIAGLTVTVVVIPQAMAYAAILGINPIFGLFTAIIPTIIAAIFSSFPFLVIGPTNPTALVTASVLMVYASRPDYIEFVFTVAIIAGIFSIVFGLLKLGALTKYISNSVMVGFLTGVGVLIISYQIGNLLGLQIPRGSSFWQLFEQYIINISEINPFTVIISLLSFGLLFLLRSINRKIPASLITILIASILVYFTGWSRNHGVALVSDFGLPENFGVAFNLPNIIPGEIFSLILPGAAVALFTLMESLSIAKSMSQMTRTNLDPSRQMISQGIASFVGGFFQCMPSSGSPSRTVINVVNGAKTRGSAIISGLGVLFFLLAFSRMIGYIPIPALTAVVIFSAAGLINFKLIKVTWQSKINSRIVMVITLISTLILPLEYAIYLGILTTILIYLGESSHLDLSYIVENEEGQYIELPLEEIKQRESQIAIVNIEGDLYFAAVDDLRSQIEKVLKTDIKVLILRFRRTHLLASTGVMTLSWIIDSARDKGIEVLFCGVQKETYEPLKTAGLTDIIGESRIFPANDTLFGSAQAALQKAKSILQEKTNEEAARNENVEL